MPQKGCKKPRGTDSANGLALAKQLYIYSTNRPSFYSLWKEVNARGEKFYVYKEKIYAEARKKDKDGNDWEALRLKNKVLIEKKTQEETIKHIVDKRVRSIDTLDKIENIGLMKIISGEYGQSTLSSLMQGIAIVRKQRGLEQGLPTERVANPELEKMSSEDILKMIKERAGKKQAEAMTKSIVPVVDSGGQDKTEETKEKLN